MSNFNFIRADFPNLYSDALEAERFVFMSPTSTAIFCRSTFENAVHWIYEHDNKLGYPFRTELNDLIHEPEFIALFRSDRTLFNEINLIRKIGNAAAHGTEHTTKKEALTSLKYLFRFLQFLMLYYGEENEKNTGKRAFNLDLIPKIPSFDEQKETEEKIKLLTADLEKKNADFRAAEQKIKEQAEENSTLKGKMVKKRTHISARKAKREKTIEISAAIPLIVSEAETRKYYIDLSLKECGWTVLREGYELEYEVKGMPVSTNPSGIGYVDYVLWGDDGLPLAVIEAKKTMAEAKKGKHQAELYANCLEKMHGQRPVIFYSNGFETYLWDDLFAPERSVQGFYSKNELQLLIDRRDSRQDLRNFKINTDIAGRPYQLEAIKRVAENSVCTHKSGKLRSGARQSLLVMATGSGKTRTASAIVDMLTKCNWAKRVLFLADRNALVSQAKNAFNEHLPHLSAIDLTKEKEDNGTRLVFSTYPTIMNRIDGKLDDFRFYGVGHFDLIIIDEAHRSVYQKYKAIFEYFDALLVGLTATPKSEVDHNTYDLFGIENNNPTFAYELDTAVAEGYLVPPKAHSIPLKFLREGIKYHELSATEKSDYEEKFGDPTQGEAADEIESSALNKWLFNTDTVNKVLNHLMTEGIKVQGGDVLGKTIIFAKNHAHAIFIEECFNKNYPQYAGKFLRVIDNYETKAQDLLEIFADAYEEQEPQIAVSVDMMDTGVDAPRVLNLVFFKQIKSSTKFWQMIGRGTRLCPDLFSYGVDKKEFVIFDYCQNFEFFDVNPDGMVNTLTKGLTQQIFEAKLEVAALIREQPDSSDEQKLLAESYITELHQLISELDKNRFVVKAEMRAVVEYAEQSRWLNLSKNDRLDISTHLSKLILPNKEDDEQSKRFDILTLNYQLTLLNNGGDMVPVYTQKISDTSQALLKKTNIPDVAVEVEMLNQLQTEPFWQDINPVELEKVRGSVRHLVKYLDPETQANVITHFEDELDLEGVSHHDVITGITRLQSYKDRVESYIKNHKDHLVIHKLKTNKSITEFEINSLEDILFDGKTIGTKQDYIDNYGDKPLGAFIRSIVGLDVAAAQEAFADFIQKGHLKADQLTFINNIISYLTSNGMIEKKMLFEAPFTNVHDQGVFGMFDEANVMTVFRLIDQVNANALAA